MLHDTPLIATIVAGLGLAFVFGAIANRLRIPPLVGYLLAGIAIGPFTPGYVADQTLAPQLAELGVILLMFGVGLHFSLKDLLSVKWIAIPGALFQIAVATAMGFGLAWWLGWTPPATAVFGISLSVASTVVLLRALQERRLIETERGRIAVGWLIVEDLAMVLALVLLPALAQIVAPGTGAGHGDPIADYLGLGLPGIIGLTVGKVAVFVALMLIVGRTVIPWILHYVAHTGSRELFRLAVLALALGTAFGAAELFGVSFALGAFFAGMILAESPLSQRAAEESLPLRDAFAVLFFVSVGMLFNPASLISNPLPLIATLFIIVIGKSLAAFLIVVAFRHPPSTALTISASLAQIGEFSFILAELGVGLGILPTEARDLILAGAILSIVINPLAFAAIDAVLPRLERKPKPAEKTPAATGDEMAPDAEPTDLPEVPPLKGHVVVVGHGRVGSRVAEALVAEGRACVVIEDSDVAAQRLQEKGIPVIAGNAARHEILDAAQLATAEAIVIAIPNVFEAGTIAERARAVNPFIRIIGRAHADEEVEHLQKLGANLVIMGEREIARGMIGALGLGRTGGTD
ncbi:MAG: YbaL family putative K(+) efflux transporter [Parvibaculaceae bacterium]